MTRTTMKSEIEKILTTHGLLETFRQSEHYALNARFHQPGPPNFI